MLNAIPYISIPNYNILFSSVLFLNIAKTILMRQLLEVNLPSSIYTQQHCSIKSEFDYFVGGCFADRPSLVHSPTTGGCQFNKQHQVQNADDGAVDVDVLQKS
jgi:hypothetical protein